MHRRFFLVGWFLASLDGGTLVGKKEDEKKVNRGVSHIRRGEEERRRKQITDGGCRKKRETHKAHNLSEIHVCKNRSLF